MSTVHETITSYAKTEYPKLEYDATTNPYGLDDEEIEYCVSRVEQYILNYTHLPSVPEGLYYTWAEIVGDFGMNKVEQKTPATSRDATVGDITSVKAGDTTISYSTSSTNYNKNSHKADLDDLMMNYRGILKTYRIFNF